MKSLTKGNIYKTFFLFGFPLVLSGLLSQAYSIIDTAIAGKFLGEHGLAAIGATAPLITVISAIFWGYGGGFCIHIAKMFGAKEYKRIKSSVHSNYLFLSILCILICGAMVLFHDPIFDFLKVEESLRKDAFIYFAVYIMGLLPITLTNSGLYLMNAFGIGGYPFYMSLLSSVLNIAGNIASVVLLKWGIFGVALSSVLSAAVVDVFYAVKLKKCFKEMGVAEEKIGYSFSHVKSSFSYAMPNTSQQMIMYFSSFLISPFVNGMGVAASASYSVVSRLYDINAAVYQNSARCVSNYSAQCVGEKEYRKIKKGVFAGFLQGALLLLPFVLACAIFHKPICSLFFKAGESLEAKEYAYTFAKYYLPFIYINMVCNLFHALFRGVKAMRHLVISTLILSLSRYFVSLLLIPKWGMHGFFAGWVLSWAAEAIYSILIFFFGRWNPEKRNLKKTIDKAV